ncbi:hypothetical protein HJC99_03620 [Candidatus Saccharibacteria bacterium]|nr:hypothetical protein [Candidatus Saccharibacteria bacterium]
MNVYLDESGIDLKSGHSVFAIVYIETEENLAVNEAMQRLNSTLKLSSFHWKDMAWSVRAKVSEVLKSLPFTFQIVYENNPLGNVDAVMSVALRRVLVGQARIITNIYIDGKNPEPLKPT